MALEIFKLVGSLFVDTAKAEDSLSKTDKKANNFAGSLAKGIGTAAKFGAAVVGGTAAAVGGVVAMANKTAETTDVIDKMSQKIGLSKQGYQEWAYVMGQNGMEVDKLQNGMKTLRSRMDAVAGGNKDTAATFAKLGISLTDASGKTKDQETVMNETIRALADVKDGTEKASLATELFGKSGLEMMPMLNGGSAGIDDLTKRAHDLGLVLSDETVTAGVKLGDTMDDVKQSFGAMATQLGATVMPLVQQFADWLLTMMPTFQTMFQQIAPIIQQVFTQLVPPIMQLVQDLLPQILALISGLLPSVTQIITAILPVIIDLLNLIMPIIVQLITTLLPPLVQIINALLPILNVAIELLKPILTLFTSLLAPIASLISGAIAPLITILTNLITMALKPVIPIIQVLAKVLSGALGGAFDALGPIINSITGYFQGLIDFISGVFTGNWSKAFEGLKAIVSNIFEALVGIIKAPINFIISGLNAFIGMLNKIKIPDWVPAVGGKGINIPLIPKLANGGLVDPGQMFIANEAGPELVGKYGNKSGVMNNNQIVDAVSAGVAKAVSAVLGSGGNNDQIVKAIKQAIESADIRASVTDDQIAGSVRRSNAKSVATTGRGLITV